MTFYDLIIYTAITIQILVLLWILSRTLIVITSLFLDVPYVPIRRKTLKKGIEILDLKEGDSVLEIGSGDGRNLFYLSKKYPNIHFVGIELHPVLIGISNFKKWILRRSNVEFKMENALEFKEYWNYNKIFFYMYSGFSNKLMKKFEKEFVKGAEIVTLMFGFGKDFESTHNIQTYDVKYISKTEKIYKWKK